MISIYTATWCPYCHMAKQYFDKLGVKYTDKDVESDIQFANEALAKSGQRGIPVIDIDGKIIIGFDKTAIDSALSAQKA